jgi:hypothetical protein
MRSLMWALPAILLGMQVVASADTVVPGTPIQVKIDQPIVAHPGEVRIYRAQVTQDVYAKDWDIVIPRGSFAEVIVRQMDPGQMVVGLGWLTIDGRRYDMNTDDQQYNVSSDPFGTGSGLRRAFRVALSRRQARVETHDTEILVPVDTRLTFQLQEPLHVGE